MPRRPGLPRLAGDCLWCAAAARSWDGSDRNRTRPRQIAATYCLSTSGSCSRRRISSAVWLHRCPSSAADLARILPLPSPLSLVRLFLRPWRPCLPVFSRLRRQQQPAEGREGSGRPGPMTPRRRPPPRSILRAGINAAAGRTGAGRPTCRGTPHPAHDRPPARHSAQLTSRPELLTSWSGQRASLRRSAGCPPALPSPRGLPLSSRSVGSPGTAAVLPLCRLRGDCRCPPALPALRGLLLSSAGAVRHARLLRL